MASTFDEQVETVSFATLANLAEDVVFRLPGCSDLMVRKTLQSVYRDFCRRSLCLLTMRRLSLEPNVQYYPVIPVYGQLVDSVVKVEIGGTGPRAHALRQGVDYKVVDGSEVRILLMRHILPKDEMTETFLNVSAVEMPSLDSETVPAWFIQKHGAAVVAGTLASLLGIANRPWSDPQSAVQERRAYENMVAEARLSYYGGGQFGTPAEDNPAASELL